jgi:hypothetical protein
MTSPSYPAALDALANPGPTTETDDTGFELDIVVSRLQNCVMALEGKLGIGASTPSAAGVLRRTTGTSTAWGTVQTGDLTAGAAGILAGIHLGAASTNSTGFVGIPATTLLFTSTAKGILFLLTMVNFRGSAGAGTAVQLWESGTNILLNTMFSDTVAAGVVATKTVALYLPGGVPAGARSYFLVWQTSAGTIQYDELTLTALEMR